MNVWESGKNTVDKYSESGFITAMINVSTLINASDAYKSAAEVDADTTVSYRMFGDSKKLSALRSGGDITVGRFNSAMSWLLENWPDGKEIPSCLATFSQEKRKGAAV
ncbi:hypothetical protein [uncultured Ruegeria sp.]|uniref:hypothetical protein n=1 Tax=uncultured Ruegeria sp. TaxID=259304 RepID=UPI00260760F9|nr:hypothetical protein [uncultured Ruegeria sp.]